MNLTEAIEYLTRCADSNGNHWHVGRSYSAEDCPTCHGTDVHDARADSRYGTWTSQVAEVAYRHAKWFARETGQELTTDGLDHSMSLAVNDHPDIAGDLQDYAARLAGANVDAMVEGYLECQLWSQLDMDRTDDCGNSPALDEHYDRSDVSDEYVETVREEFAALVADHPLAVRMYIHRTDYRSVYAECHDRSALFGHDFYLTREGHGAGFWDRGLGELGDYLTKISKWSGPADDLSDNGSGVLSA